MTDSPVPRNWHDSRSGMHHHRLQRKFRRSGMGCFDTDNRHPCRGHKLKL